VLKRIVESEVSLVSLVSLDQANNEHYHVHAHIERIRIMKTERVTLLTTPEFKAFLTAEAARDGVSVAELVRVRCEQRPSTDEELLRHLAAELRTAVAQAKKSLRSGLEEADTVLAELRTRRSQPAVPPSPRKAKLAA
jgi:GAF domain-containing protein